MAQEKEISRKQVKMYQAACSTLTTAGFSNAGTLAGFVVGGPAGAAVGALVGTLAATIANSQSWIGADDEEMKRELGKQGYKVIDN